MAQLSEEQLLLLNNLMYYRDESAGSGHSGSVYDLCEDILSKSDSELGSNLSGGFEKDPQNMREIAEAIMNDPQLSSLRPVDSVFENNVYATCFEDPSTGEATVAIRGTGGSYEAWSDNVKGAYDTDTHCQETMMAFAQRLKDSGYTDITITGHSKGGNLAQYVTILSDDLVGRCVSFDGQGFNNDFLEKYASQIAENSSKIKSICAYNDYVNVMLNSVAGETVFLPNDQTDFSGAHSSFALWKSNQGKQRYGCYYEFADQDPNMAMLDVLLDKFTNDLNELPAPLQALPADFLAALAGAFFGISTKQISAKDVFDALWSAGKLNFLMKFNPALRELFKAWLLVEIGKLIYYAASGEMEEDIQRKRSRENQTQIHPAEFYVNLAILSASLSDLDQCKAGIERIIGEMEDLDVSWFFMRAKVKYVIALRELRNASARISTLYNALDRLTEKYDNCEKRILAQAGDQ